jgi:hypothetical protein
MPAEGDLKGKKGAAIVSKRVMFLLAALTLCVSVGVATLHETASAHPARPQTFVNHRAYHNFIAWFPGPWYYQETANQGLDALVYTGPNIPITVYRDTWSAGVHDGHTWPAYFAMYANSYIRDSYNNWWTAPNYNNGCAYPAGDSATCGDTGSIYIVFSTSGPYSAIAQEHSVVITYDQFNEVLSWNDTWGLGSF